MEGHLEVWTAAGRTLLPLGSLRCTVGSSTESDLVMDVPSVSRTHLLLEQLGGAWFVEDLGSRNGIPDAFTLESSLGLPTRSSPAEV